MKQSTNTSVVFGGGLALGKKIFFARHVKPTGPWGQRQLKKIRFVARSKFISVFKKPAEAPVQAVETTEYKAKSIIFRIIRNHKKISYYKNTLPDYERTLRFHSFTGASRILCGTGSRPLIFTSLIKKQGWGFSKFLLALNVITRPKRGRIRVKGIGAFEKFKFKFNSPKLRPEFSEVTDFFKVFYKIPENRLNVQGGILRINGRRINKIGKVSAKIELHNRLQVKHKNEVSKAIEDIFLDYTWAVLFRISKRRFARPGQRKNSRWEIRRKRRYRLRVGRRLRVRLKKNFVKKFRAYEEKFFSINGGAVFFWYRRNFGFGSKKIKYPRTRFLPHRFAKNLKLKYFFRPFKTWGNKWFLYVGRCHNFRIPFFEYSAPRNRRAFLFENALSIASEPKEKKVYFEKSTIYKQNLFRVKADRSESLFTFTD